MKERVFNTHKLAKKKKKRQGLLPNIKCFARRIYRAGIWDVHCSDAGLGAQGWRWAELCHRSRESHAPRSQPGSAYRPVAKRKCPENRRCSEEAGRHVTGLQADGLSSQGGGASGLWGHSWLQKPSVLWLQWAPEVR